MNIEETLTSGLMDVIPHQVWTATPDGNLDYFNEQWFNYSKWSYQESKGSGWARAIHPDDLPDLVVTWTKALQTLEPYRVSARILRHDNTYRWHTIHALAVKGEKNEVLRWVGTNTDIHDQKLLEEKLNINANELTIAHYEEKQAKERAFDLNNELLQTQNALETFNQELEQRVIDRTSELEKARKEITRQRDKLRRFFMEAPAGICILEGPELRFELANSTYQQLLPERDILKRPIFEALPELIGTPIEDALKSVYTTGKTFYGNEIHIPVMKHTNGPIENRYFNFVYQARHDEDGNVDGVMAFVFEVTMQVNSKKNLELLYQEIAATNEELQSAYEEIQTTNEELQSANEEIQTSNEELEETNQQLSRTNNDLDNFIYTASHDLKAPISNIEGLVIALTESLQGVPNCGEDTLHLLSFIETSVERFKKTIKDLTDISRIQKDNDQDQDLVPITEVLDEVLLDLTFIIKSSDARIILDVEKFPCVFSSRKNLRSVIYNLLSNSIKYRHPDRNPEIHLACDEDDVYTIISVKDNGLGIDIKKEHKLFAMFGRLHNHVEGTGVGLYMVKKIIENAGGKIEVESEVDKGSTFKVYFKKDKKIDS